MFFKKHVYFIAFFTLVNLFCLSLAPESSFAQNESPLIKAQELYRKKNFVDSVKVLETFINTNWNNQAENKRLAEAYYLLARINFDCGEDARTEYFLKLAVAVNDQIGNRETNLDFKALLDQVKGKGVKPQAAENKIVPEMPTEIKKTEEIKPISTEAALELLDQSEALFYGSWEGDEIISKLLVVERTLKDEKYRERILFDLSLNYYYLGEYNKCVEMLLSLFEINIQKTIDATKYRTGFVETFYQVNKIAQYKLKKQKKSN